MKQTAQSEVGELRSLLLKHARDAFVSDAVIDRDWQALGYEGRPDLAKAVAEYDELVALLKKLNIEPLFAPGADSVGLDSIYVRDAAVVSDKGIVLCSMGKEARRGEPAVLEAALRAAAVPVLGAITGEGRVEGGDVLWLDAGTLVVGRGYRTNDAGIEQLWDLLQESVEELIVVPLPHYKGPGDVFHLMSVMSPLDRDLALVFSPLLPVPFRETLLERDVKLVEVPAEEFETMACNVLAVAPRRCIALDGNPRTRALMESAGVEVHVYEGEEISRKGAGGPTCLTRPLLRAV
jgi:N-dimethylarginine dimethylaminohydrolase